MKTSILLCAAALFMAVGAAHAEDCKALEALRLPHVTITAASTVPADSATKLAYCRVQATSKPTTDSDIRMEVWIPLDAGWNGKFEQVGNGGFAGAIPARAMAHAVAAGYAVAGTDDGHQSTEMTDAAWALGHEEKIKDYGSRAISETALASKRIVQKFKSKAPAKSYFVGCSDGGREALMMAQRFPLYFDGIVAGAPAYTMSRLLTSGAVRSAQLNSVEGRLSQPKLALLQSAALKMCASGARYIKDPRQCRPDLEALRCSNGDAATCLTDPQIATAQLIYGQQRDPVKGDVLYGVLPGAEGVKGSWDAWLTGTDGGGKPAGIAFTDNYLAYMVMHDAHFDPSKVTKGDIARGEIHYGPIMDASDPDLSAFKTHGGKLIQYHGWNDPGIAPGYSLEYHARVTATMGTVDDFYRLYMVPGMLHCGGGDAPTNVDWQAAIEAWVERGTAPGVLTASDAQGATQALSPFVTTDADSATVR